MELLISEMLKASDNNETDKMNELIEIILKEIA